MRFALDITHNILIRLEKRCKNNMFPTGMGWNEKVILENIFI